MASVPRPEPTTRYQPNFCFGTRMCSQPEAGAGFNPGWIARSKSQCIFAPTNAILAQDRYRGHGDAFYPGWVTVWDSVEMLGTNAP